MEEQHPIPQQISSYQFRLVGDMTLKQFFQVAGGAIIALIVYSSGLPSYVKWPVIIVSFLFGVALAFFPLEDRPLETWIFAFLKSIYSPTVYVWKKLPQKHSVFQPEPAPAAGAVTPALVQATPREAVVVNLQEPTAAFPSLEKGEQEFLSKVSEHFNAPAAPVLIPTAFPSQGLFRPTAVPLRKKVEVDRVKPIHVEPTLKATREPPKKPEAPSSGSNIIGPSVGRKIEGSLAARFSLEAAPPIPPTKPNVIVGQVVDPDGKIVESAILEIKDEEGRSVRALKSNKLGHFMIVTPLSDGKYQIITEKEGLNFDPASLTVKGEIVQPIAIWAKSQAKKTA